MRPGKTLTSLLLAAAILAPAVVLAVLGLRAYRAEALLLRERFKQDQRAIVQLVAGRITESARKALQDLEARCASARPSAPLEARFTTAHPLARNIFVLQQGRLVYPPAQREPASRTRAMTRDAATFALASDLDVKRYVGRLREGRRLSRLVRRGLAAEHGGQLSRARALYRRAIGGHGDPSARALLGLARVERRQGRGLQAALHYRLLGDRFAGRRDGEQVSYDLLAHAGLATLPPTSGHQRPAGKGLPAPRARLMGLPQIHARLLQGGYNTSPQSRRFFLRWVLQQLRGRSGEATRLARLQQATRRFYAAERFGAMLQRHDVRELQQQATHKISSLALNPRTVLVLRRRQKTVVGYSVSEAHLRRQVSRAGRHGPTGRAVRLELGRVGQRSPLPEARVVYSSVLEAPLGHWTLSGALPSAGALETEQQRGRMLRLGLVVGMILVLLTGMLMAFRAVRRETELARLKSDFASNVSHELKTPLTSIRMYAEMLQHGIAETPEDRSRYHSVIVREAERLGRLITNVLDFSKLERGERRYNLEPEDLGEMITEALETYGRLSERDGVSIRFDGGHELAPAPVTADREAAVQCILNLLSNAAKYAPEDPTITVELMRQDEELGVRVSDRGIGIPAAQQKRIFDDFYRAPGAAQAGVEGTGLGLALVRRHMHACQGRVELTSTPGQGSRFTLWFPRAAANSERTDAADTDH